MPSRPHAPTCPEMDSLAQFGFSGSINLQPLGVLSWLKGHAHRAEDISTAAESQPLPYQSCQQAPSHPT